MVTLLGAGVLVAGKGDADRRATPAQPAIATALTKSDPPPALAATAESTPAPARPVEEPLASPRSGKGLAARRNPSRAPEPSPPRVVEEASAHSESAIRSPARPEPGTALPE